MSFGTPTGSARIAGVDQRGAARAAGRDDAGDAALARASSARTPPPSPATDAPRSPVKTPVEPRGWCSATSSGGTSAPEGLPLVDRSTSRVAQAGLA